MARNEANRDDLYAELKSAVGRWELAVPGCDVATVAGIRSGNRLSIYFGPDPCYHFDAKHRLKRAYAAGDLYRTQGTTLARLTRTRTAAETTLERHDLTSDELAAFLREMRHRLSELLAWIRENDVTVLRHSTQDEPRSTTGLSILSDRLTACLAVDPPLAPPFPTRRQ